MEAPAPEVDFGQQLDLLCGHLVDLGTAVERLTMRLERVEETRPTREEINGLTECVAAMGVAAINVRTMMCVEGD